MNCIQLLMQHMISFIYFNALGQFIVLVVFHPLKTIIPLLLGVLLIDTVALELYLWITLGVTCLSDLLQPLLMLIVILEPAYSFKYIGV